MPNPKNRNEVHETRIVRNGQDNEFVSCSVICNRWSAIAAAISAALPSRYVCALVVGCKAPSDAAKASIVAALSAIVGSVSLPLP